MTAAVMNIVIANFFIYVLLASWFRRLRAASVGNARRVPVERAGISGARRRRDGKNDSGRFTARAAPTAAHRAGRRCPRGVRGGDAVPRRSDLQSAPRAA